MDAALNVQTLLLLLLVGAVVLSIVNLIAVLLLRFQVERKRERIEDHDRRISVLEERLSGIGELKAGLSALSNQVAALNERSETTLEMVHSIQDFLREQSNERS